jgi:hypothetical protein
LSLSRPLLYVA